MVAGPGVRARLGKIAWRTTVTLAYLFLLAPIIIVVFISFNSQPFLSFPPEGLSLQWYGRALQNTRFMSGLGVSVIVGVGVALIVCCVAVPAAWVLSRKSFRGSGLINGFFMTPLVVPTVTLALGLLLIFAPLGLTGTYTGLIFAHIGLTFPYAVRTILARFGSYELSYEEAARSLGASVTQSFFRVSVPLVAPGVVAAAVISFLVSFDEAVIALFVVGGGHTTLPVEIFRYVARQTDPEVAALSVLMIVISTTLILVVERLIGVAKALR